MTAIIKPYIPNIPAMTIGTIDFMMRSGFNTPIVEIPMPALAVPYAAPRFAMVKAIATPQ